MMSNPNPSQMGDFTAPLNGATSGRLVFASGATNVTIRSEPALAELMRARFEQQAPGVRVYEGTITIQYRTYGLFDWLTNRREPVATITLTPTVPWEIEFTGGVSKLKAELGRLHLRSLDLNSVSDATLVLPRPMDITHLCLSGSASNLTIYRPTGVALRLHIGGGASNLRIDGQRFGAIGGGLDWQSADEASAPARVEINISGSVSNLTVAER